MARRPISPFLRYLHHLYGNREIAGLTDGQLLQRFAAERDEEAFTLLVRRHGAMVLGVCERLLNDPHEAEDAFQATFLVLARKASLPGWRDSIGNWLYGVALRVASKMKAQARRRQMEERQRDDHLARAAERAVNQSHWDTARRELARELDAALQRLPGKYRAPLVLCYLEGKSHKDAARELGLPPGSMSRRLARGCELLRERLQQNGCCFTPEALATLLTEGIWRGSFVGTPVQGRRSGRDIFAGGSAVTSAMRSPPKSLFLTKGGGFQPCSSHNGKRSRCFC